MSECAWNDKTWICSIEMIGENGQGGRVPNKFNLNIKYFNLGFTYYKDGRSIIKTGLKRELISAGKIG